MPRNSAQIEKRPPRRRHTLSARANGGRSRPIDGVQTPRRFHVVTESELPSKPQMKALPQTSQVKMPRIAIHRAKETDLPRQSFLICTWAICTWAPHRSGRIDVRGTPKRRTGCSSGSTDRRQCRPHRHAVSSAPRCCSGGIQVPSLFKSPATDGAGRMRDSACREQSRECRATNPSVRPTW